jgi:hypothetical protein
MQTHIYCIFNMQCTIKRVIIRKEKVEIDTRQSQETDNTKEKGDMTEKKERHDKGNGWREMR